MNGEYTDGSTHFMALKNSTVQNGLGSYAAFSSLTARARSLEGGNPNGRAYSRLNWFGLSYPHAVSDRSRGALTRDQLGACMEKADALLVLQRAE